MGLNRVVVAIAAFALGAVVTLLGSAALADDDPGIEIGETFEAEVESYFDASGPEPNLICLVGDGDDCGLPVFGTDEAPAISPGDRVVVTEVWLREAEGVQRLAYFVEPLG